MKKELTAVEWLCEEYHINEDSSLVIQAKQMEKEQIKEAYLRGIANYDPTFKTK